MNHTDDEAQRRIQTLSGFDPTTLPGQRETPAQEALRLRAEVERLRAGFEAVREFTRDRNPDGKTLVDFLNVWLDQARQENASLCAQLAAATGRLGEATAALQLYADPKNWTPLLGGDSWMLMGVRDPWKPAEAALAPPEKETK